MVDAEQLVVDQTLDEVEDAPPRQHHPDVSPPGRRQLLSPPRPHGQQHGYGHKEPRREVEEPVGERVRLEAGDRVAWMIPGVREQVVPLQDLVEQDAVDEPPEAEAQDEGRRLGASRSGRLRRDGHEATYPLGGQATPVRGPLPSDRLGAK